MMAKGDTVTKNKKSNSFKPYDANNSLVRRVTSRVSQYLPQPTTWFRSFLTLSNSTEQSANPPFTEEDGPQPAKRLRTAQTNTDFPQDVPSVDLNLDSRREEISPIRSVGTASRPEYAVAGPSGLQRNPFVASTPSAASGNKQTLVPKVNGDDASDSESASCSSVPLFGRGLRGEKTVYSFHRPLHLPPPPLIKGPAPGSSKQARVELNTSLQLKEQHSFDSTVFFSPFKGRLCGSELSPSLLNCSSHDSSFYKGNTTFGGASSSIDSLFRTRTLPSETPVIVKPTETTKQSCNLATSTTRILKALEQFSSPVLDARKMAPGRTSGSRRPAPFRELVVPTMPDLLRIKRRDARQLRAARAAARTAAAAASHSSTSPAQVAATLSAEASAAVVGSQSSQPLLAQTRLNSGDSNMEITFAKKTESSDKASGNSTSTIPTVSFSSLPKFDPGIVKPISPLHSSQKQDVASIDSLKSFTFSKPISVTQEAPPPSPSCWKFRKPLNPEEGSKHSDDGSKSEALPVPDSSLCPSETKMVYSPPRQINLKRKQPLVPNSAKIFSSQLTMKKVASSEPSPLKETSNSRTKKSEDQWECKECYVQNKASQEKCSACELARNPEEFSSSNPVTEKTKYIKEDLFISTSANPFTGFGDKFKMRKDQWECSACLVKNDIKDTKCVSCGQAKESKNESVKPVPSSSETKVSLSVSQPVKMSSETWEWKDCYVKNKASDTSCVSCTSKNKDPAITVQCNSLSTTTTVPGLSTNSTPLSSLFKKPEGMWECDSCLVQNKSDITSCAACGSVKPGCKVESKPAPSCGFSFGIPPEQQGSFGAKIVTSSSAEPLFGSAQSAASSVPSAVPTFTFGQPASSSASSPAPVFSFGVPPKTEEKSEKPAETSVASSNIFSQPFKTTGKSDEGDFNCWLSKKASNEPSTPVPMSPDQPDSKTSPFGVSLNKSDVQSSKPASTFSFGNTNAVVNNAMTTASSNSALGQSNPLANAFTTRALAVPSSSTNIINAPLFAIKSNPVQTKTETTNSFEPSLTASTQEVKNIFGSVLSKPQTLLTDSSTGKKKESVFDKAEDKSNIFVFGSSDKTNSVNCDAPKPSGFFGASKIAEPKTNALKPHNSEPGKMGFGSSGTFGNQATAFSSGFGSAGNANNEKSFTFGSNAGGFSFKPTDSSTPAFSFGTKSNEQSLVNHTNCLGGSTSQFGSTAPAFGSRPANANDAPSSGFATSTAPQPAPVFNFSSPQQNSSSPFSASPFSSTTPQNSGGNIATPTSSAFTFGAAQPQPVTQAPPAFDPNAKPTFNFSSGQSSSFPSKTSVGGSTGGFSFKPSETPAPTFSFGAKPSEQTALVNHTNSLGGSNAEFGGPTSTFGSQPASGGLFNSPASGFGASSAPRPGPPVFSFSAPQQNSPSPFSFSAPQGTVSRAAAPASVGFTFGAAHPPAAAQAPPAFDPNAKPTFNFSAGQPPTFSAGTPGDAILPLASDSTAKPMRKFRKAVRRTVPK